MRAIPAHFPAVQRIVGAQKREFWKGNSKVSTHLKLTLRLGLKIQAKLRQLQSLSGVHCDTGVRKKEGGCKAPHPRQMCGPVSPCIHASVTGSRLGQPPLLQVSQSSDVPSLGRVIRDKAPYHKHKKRVVKHTSKRCG